MLARTLQASAPGRREAAPTAGHGLVVTAQDGAWEGLLYLDRRARTIDVYGRLRVRCLIGGEEVATYRALRHRTWPLSVVRRIAWTDSDREVAA